MKGIKPQEIRALAQRLELQLQAIRRRLRQSLEAEFARGKVTGPQQLVMAALVDSGRLNLKQLSEKVSLAHSTVSGIVDRLEKRGMVTRHILGSDRRVTRITPSDEVLHFLRTRMPELTLHPLVKALHKATSAERKAIRTGIDTLEKLLQSS
ncbi:MAG: MarR family transcriptional regulator [Candidatus Sulfotelmatobacter sp.]